MGEWTEMFRSDPDLGFMEQAYMRLKSQSQYSVRKAEDDEADLYRPQLAASSSTYETTHHGHGQAKGGRRTPDGTKIVSSREAPNSTRTTE